jgi:hypothetical protein
VLRGIFFHKFLHPVSELSCFQQQQLDNEEADLSLASFLGPQCLKLTLSLRREMCAKKILYQAKNQSVNGDDVVFPHHVIDGIYALVDMLATSGICELVHEIVAEFSKVSR